MHRTLLGQNGWSPSHHFITPAVPKLWRPELRACVVWSSMFSTFSPLRIWRRSIASPLLFFWQMEDFLVYSGADAHRISVRFFPSGSTLNFDFREGSLSVDSIQIVAVVYERARSLSFALLIRIF
jgi:hypothetical protein